MSSASAGNATAPDISLVLATGEPGALGASILVELRPVVSEIVVAVDSRLGEEDLAWYASVADRVLRYEFNWDAQYWPWLAAQASGEWLLRIDGDEVPSAALIDALPKLASDRRIRQYWTPRLWLWPDPSSHLVDSPWGSDHQPRLIRNDGVTLFSTTLHEPTELEYPLRFLNDPIYHLDLLLMDEAARRAKADRYDRTRFGLLTEDGRPFNQAWYVPEDRPAPATSPVPDERDRRRIERVLSVGEHTPAPPAPAPGPFPLHDAAEIEYYSPERALGPDAYQAEIELLDPLPTFSAGGPGHALRIRVKNTGTARWPGGDAHPPLIRVGVCWRLEPDQLLKGGRAPLPHPLEPGEETLIPLWISAPAVPGPAELAVDLVHENVRWFESPATARVEIEPSAVERLGQLDLEHGPVVPVPLVMDVRGSLGRVNALADALPSPPPEAGVEGHPALRAALSHRVAGRPLDGPTVEGLADAVASARPAYVAVFGSGVGTVLLARLLAELHGKERVRVLSFEHEERFIGATRAALREHDLDSVATVVRLPLGPMGGMPPCYDLTDEARRLLRERPPGLILVHGPALDSGASRLGVTELVAPFAAPGALVLLTDALRDEGLRVGQDWAARPDTEVLGIRLVGGGLLEARIPAAESAIPTGQDRAEPGVAKILSACAHLEQGRLEEVLRVIGEGPNHESVMSESISLCARGLIFERQGNAAEADRCFERVLSHGAPLRIVLRESGRYFKRAGEYEKAYRCYSVLQNYEGESMHEFLERLPPPEGLRYSPWTVRTHDVDGHWFLPPVKEDLVAELGAEGAALALLLSDYPAASPSMMAESTEILRACESLERGHPEQAADILDQSQGSGSPVSESVSITARGLIAEREGNAAEADRCFEKVLARGVPIPVLLWESGRYFKRIGRFDEAYQCYSVLVNFDPPAIMAITEFLQGLPPPALSRYSPWLVKRLVTMPRPQLYQLQSIKEALASQLGPEGAAVAYAEMSGLDPGWDAKRVRLTGLQEFAKEHGLLYEELSPSRIVDLLPLPVIGEAQPGIRSRTRSVFFCLLEDVIVSSKSNLLLAGDRALLDYQAELEGSVSLNLDVDPIALAPSDDSITAVIGRGGVSKPELEEAFPLVGVHSDNYGHWLFEFLLKVLACRDRSGFDSVPILIDDQMPPQHREALELLLGRDQPIIVLGHGEAVRVKKLWTCSMFAYFAVGAKPGEYDSREVLQVVDGREIGDLFDSLRVRVEALPRQPGPGPGPGPGRIYLTRKDSQHRRLVNRLEVEDWFSSQGFEIVDPAELPFAEQLALVRGAELIVGPDGSALLTSFLARPGTGVGYLNNPYLEDHWGFPELCKRLDLRLSILTGEVVRRREDYRKFSDYRIDVGMLPAFLNELLSP